MGANILEPHEIALPLLPTRGTTCGSKAAVMPEKAGVKHQETLHTFLASKIALNDREYSLETYAVASS